MSNHSDSTRQNQILAALTPESYERVLPHLEPVHLSHAKLLYEIDDPIEHVYFPFRAMVSLVTQMADGKIVEVGLVGKEGMTGIAGLMGHANSYERAIVQIADGGVRTRLSVVREEFDKGGGFQQVLLRYANGLMRQVSQTAACNASHTAEERLSRWLLMCHDRVDSLELNLTQEFLAEMLGTRRGTVNVAAITLQSANLIRYQRGHITIVDRPGLEAFACECYSMLQSRDGGGGETRPSFFVL
jgi:CRP-like cAMP-binding protein